MRALCLLALLAGPSPAARAAAGDVLVYAMRSETESFDPAWAYDNASAHVIANVYETPFAFVGGGYGLVPRLAAEVPTRANGGISPDGLVYRIRLREGVRFHDGSPLTADDARYSLLRFLLTDREGGPSAELLEPILGTSTTRGGGRLAPETVERLMRAVAVEKDALVIRLRRPYAPFLAKLAYYGAVQSRSWCAARGQWDGRAETAGAFNGLAREASLGRSAMNGTGPFRLLRHDALARQTVLERHDAYWRGSARLKTVVIKTVPEFATRKLMLQAGDADVIDAPVSYASQLRGLPGVELMEGLRPLASPYVLYFNQALDPVANPNIGSGRLDGDGIPPDFFSDIDVRRGFARALDYEGYARDVMRGLTRQSGGIVPDALRGEPRAPRYTRDLEKARAHFRAAWGGKVWEKGFRLTLVSNEGGDEALAFCRMLKREVESLHPRFRVDIRVIQWSSMLDHIRARKLPLHLALWRGAYPDPDEFAVAFLHSRGHYASTHGYADAKVDGLIERAVATAEPGRRAALYREVEDRAAEAVPFVPVVEKIELRAQSARVKGFVFGPTFPHAPGGSYYYDLWKDEKAP